MREILFRGKRTDNGEWVYGYYCPVVRGRFPATPCIVPDIDGMWEGIPIIPETVGQYTGLKDKNGNKIFEGDIVNYVYEPGKGYWNANQKSVIKWDGEGFYMYGIEGTNKYALTEGWLNSIPLHNTFFEVIGNIHDNPELLEVE